MTGSKPRSGSARRKGETVETRFVAIDKSDITGAELRGRDRADHGAFRLAARSRSRATRPAT